MHNTQQILEAKDFIMSKINHRPTIGLILGSLAWEHWLTISKIL
ncbi:Uncharacterised protein [Paenibacillus macerans]|uniref:Uncharacterized protein n=1 Tax=Paenibacillus macerans TaxID=44252 RepID=A0A090Y9U7_PAEMA|nr:hypothetical protein DJ90_5848 [Paenibacillus macerans]SUD26032.1 Uncharacterised protein [Paenibacillus macerans]